MSHAKGQCRIALLGAVAALSVAPAAHSASCWPEPVTEAARMQQLNVILASGAMRCAAGPDDFRAEYQRFARQHRVALSEAKALMLARYSVGMGESWASSAIDYMKTAAADRASRGDGPTCSELRSQVEALADGAREDLVQAADTVIADRVITPGCTRRIARTH